MGLYVPLSFGLEASVLAGPYSIYPTGANVPAGDCDMVNSENPTRQIGPHKRPIAGNECSQREFVLVPEKCDRPALVGCERDHDHPSWQILAAAPETIVPEP